MPGCCSASSNNAINPRTPPSRDETESNITTGVSQWRTNRSMEYTGMVPVVVRFWTHPNYITYMGSGFKMTWAINRSLPDIPIWW